MSTSIPTLCASPTPGAAQKGAATACKCVRLGLICSLLAGMAAAQDSRAVRYRPVLENASVAVFTLELPPGFHASSLQNEHDVFWIGLNEARITFADSDGNNTDVRLRPGDVRFFSSFSTQSVANRGDATFQGVLLELKKRTTSVACMCGSEAERSVCGCARAAPLPELWAVALHNVTVAGTTLAMGQEFAGTIPRGDTVLVAITSITLRENPGAEADASQPVTIQLGPGGAVWIPAGLHRLQNIGLADARFVTLEF